MRVFDLAAVASAFIATAGSASTTEQVAVDRLAATLGYEWTIVDNRPSCPARVPECFLTTLTLKMPDTLPQALPQDLSLYFSFVSRLPLVESDIFNHRLVNGDLQQLTLKPGARLRPGASYVVRLWGSGAHFSKAYAMPNAYLAAPAVQARTIAASKPVIDRDTGLERLRFVAPMTNEAKLATKTDSDKTRWLTAERAFEVQAARQAPSTSGVVILPKPVQAVQQTGPAADLTRGYRLQLNGIKSQAIAPALVALGVRDGGPLPLRVRVDNKSLIPAEGYELTLSSSGIDILARDEAGAQHALRSLAQQAAFEGNRLRPLQVKDAPHYAFRGLHIDLARNFHGREQLLKLIEALAAFKLNKLHLHLADDEGWRIEVPALPELAAVGSKRCHDPSETTCLLPQLGAGPDGTGAVNGYLSAADYIAILRAAAARNIEIIPSIDMPGHSRAAIKAMEVRYARLMREGKGDQANQFRLIDPADRTDYRSIQNYNDNTLNVCIPATYRFVDTVVDALASMHRQAGVPLRTFHLGADETAGAWVKSPRCAGMIAANKGDARQLTPRFIERVTASLSAKRILVGGWSDGMGHTDPAAMPKKVQSNIWGLMQTGAVREAHDQMNRGWDVVLSIPTFLYLDMPYAPHPDEGGYDWAARGIDTYQAFAFMPDNLPANAATTKDLSSNYRVAEDQPVRQPGRKITGIQGQLWSETVRTNSQVDYMLFPRLLALAERAWTPASWTPAYEPGATYKWQDGRVRLATLDAEWKQFAGRVAAQFPMLDRLGIAYRVAPPGGRIVDGRLQANSVFPGTRTEYRDANGKWVQYTQPVAVSGKVELRSRSADGKRVSRTVQVGDAPR